MTQSNPQLPNNLSPSSPTENSGNTLSNATNAGGAPPPRNNNNRVEGRDFSLQQSATVALLPSIAEEKHLNGFSHHVPYQKSISLIDQHQKFTPPTPADLSSTDKAEVSFPKNIQKVLLQVHARVHRYIHSIHLDF